MGRLGLVGQGPRARGCRESWNLTASESTAIVEVEVMGTKRAKRAEWMRAARGVSRLGGCRGTVWPRYVLRGAMFWHPMGVNDGVSVHGDRLSPDKLATLIAAHTRRPTAGRECKGTDGHRPPAPNRSISRAAPAA
jgi:hypothetical protein